MRFIGIKVNDNGNATSNRGEVVVYIVVKTVTSTAGQSIYDHEICNCSKITRKHKEIFIVTCGLKHPDKCGKVPKPAVFLRTLPYPLGFANKLVNRNNIPLPPRVNVSLL